MSANNERVGWSSRRGSVGLGPGIAIVGMACIYPDARTPGELWENVLAQRSAFRRLPPERLRPEDYWSADRDAPDRTALPPVPSSPASPEPPAGSAGRGWLVSVGRLLVRVR